MAYGQIGMMQASAGFFAYFVIMAENGFWPSLLFGLRRQWDSKAVNDLQDSYGQEWVRSSCLIISWQCSFQIRCSFIDVRCAQTTRVHLSHCLLHFDCGRAMGRLDHLQDSAQFFVPAGHEEPRANVRSLLWDGRRLLVVVHAWYGRRSSHVPTQVSRPFVLSPTRTKSNCLLLLRINWWAPAIPFSILIFVYDEIRKYIIRANPGGWVEKETYY